MRFSSPANTGASTALPEPDRIARAHSEKLIRHVRGEITANNGYISLARYMELILFAPGLGYYSAGSRKFGAEGDFVTAPEISPLFSRCLARQVSEVLATLGTGSVLEVGAGSGAMAADMLAELESLQQLPETYQILELSAELRGRQRETLAARVPHLLARVQWLDALPPAGFEGVVLANELLDALPAHGFCLQEDGVRERVVGWADERFVWQLAELSEPQLAARLQALAEQLPPGYCSEINPAAEAWVHSMAAALQRGVILLLDYGFTQQEFYHPQRNQGTLMCHYRHRSHHDPFVYPGLQDVTTHVNFSAIAEAALQAGLQMGGYTTQGFFLLANGITDLAQAAGDVGERQRMQVAQQVRTLTMPDEMGELFKVMALVRGVQQRLRGFSMRDMRERL